MTVRCGELIKQKMPPVWEAFEREKGLEPAYGRQARVQHSAFNQKMPPVREAF